MGKARSVAVLDAGALIALERGNERMRALCREALRRKATLMIPAGVLAQVWRGGSRQAVLASLLSAPCAQVEALDEALARAAGTLCGQAGTKDPIDASVVILARRFRATIVTSDANDLRRLDPSARIEEM